MLLKAVGFWREGSRGETRLIHPKYLVDPQWERDRRDQIVAYLRSGVRVCSYLGYSYCRFRGGPSYEEMGDSDFSDGVWEWPEGLWVYVEMFGVRLPEEFITHMEENAFRIPDYLDLEELRTADRDFTFWERWCEEQVALYRSRRWPRLKRLLRWAGLVKALPTEPDG